MRISLFVTCLTDTFFPETGRAVVTVLERLGHEVDFPEEQTCCGQMHANTGYREEALPLVRRFVETFADRETIVVPSASCATLVRDWYVPAAEAANDPGLAREAAAVSSRIVELTELLVDRLGVTDLGAAYPHRVAYHPTCHSLRSLEVGDRPFRLLRAVRGIELVELERAEECCGFGGTFAVKNADTSAAILADKLEAIVRSGAEACTALDNSCLMQIRGGLARAGADVRTLHLAEILAS